MTEENRENKKTGIIELLRELATRIKEEIFLLAFVFALIIAFVVIISSQISLVTGATFVAIYSIAVISYLAIKGRKTSQQIKEESSDYIKWVIKRPDAFQNPNVIQKESPELALVHFDIDVSLENMSTKPLSCRVYVRSPSQAVLFVWDETKEIWRRKLGFIPFKEKFERSLDIWEIQRIDPKRTGNYRFHGWYRPRKAFDDFFSRNSIVLSYMIYAESDDSIFQRIYFDTGVKKIEIPFKDVVHYRSKKKYESNS